MVHERSTLLLRQNASPQGAGALLLNPLKQFREQEGHSALLASQVVLDVGMKALTGQHQQVFRSVVGAVPVPVVNDLAGEERTAQPLSGDLTVQCHLLSQLAVPDSRVPFALPPSYAEGVSFNRWLLGLLGAGLLAQSLAFALKFGWAAALGVLVLSVGAGYVLAPRIKASEQRRMGAFLFNLAAVLGSLVVDSRDTDALCLVTTAVVVMLLWDEEGPHLSKRLREQWHKQASRLARPVIALPS